MPVIPPPPPVVPTPELLAAQEVDRTLSLLAAGEDHIAGSIRRSRTAGAAAMYASVPHANAVLAKIRERGGKAAVRALIANDLRLRAVLESHAPGSGGSPVPAGMVLVPLDANGQPTADVAAADDFTVQPA